MGAGAFVAADVVDGVHDLMVDAHAALVDDAIEGLAAQPVVEGAGKVVAAAGEGVFERLIGEGIELDGPEFEVEVACAEIAAVLIRGEFGGGFEDPGDDAGFPFGRDCVSAGVEMVFAGVLAGAGLAFGRAGAGGLLGVGAAGGGLLFRLAEERHGYWTLPRLRWLVTRKKRRV